MSTIHLAGDWLAVQLTRSEKIAALHGNLRIPLAAIRAADVVPDGLAAAKGLRAPGLAVPGRLKFGTWRGRGTKHFVAVRRGQPAIRLQLTGHPYDSVLVSTPHAAEVATAVTERRAAQRRTG